MTFELVRSGPSHRVPVVLLLLLFAGLGIARYDSGGGDDLAASYLGCRIVAAGDADQLYDYDPVFFSEVGDGEAWPREADAGGFEGFLHPYVQTPLWAYALEPLCTRTSFAAFSRIFVVALMLCFAGAVWLVARFWTPGLLHPLAIAILLFGLWISEPFRYAMVLLQTHVLFLLLVLGALLLAQRRWPVLAGFLLACATAVKITPGFLLLYWLITRQWKAAISMAGWTVALGVGTLGISGPALTGSYLAGLHRVAGTLLLSENNQSFAAWVMGRFYNPDEAFDLRILALPAAVKIGSTLLTLAGVVAGGLVDWDRQRSSSVEAPTGAMPLPLGAMMALVAATIFAPIAWTHYFILLLVPIMFLLEENRRLRSRLIAGMILVMVILNVQPIAANVEDGLVGPVALLRSSFFSGVICLVALGLAAMYGRPKPLSGYGADVRTSRLSRI